MNNDTKEGAPSGASTIDNPAGGVELYKALRALAEEYRMHAAAERDYDAASMAIALEALVLHASHAGVHLHLKLTHEDRGAA